MLYFAVSDAAIHTPGQDYCGLTLVSPALASPQPTRGSSAVAAYAALARRDYLLLYGALALSQYLLSPRPGHAGASSSAWRVLLQAFSEIHRMFLLVDGRYGVGCFVSCSCANL